MKRRHYIIVITLLFIQSSFAFIAESYSSHHLVKTVSVPAIKNAGNAALYNQAYDNLQISLCVLCKNIVLTASAEVNELVALVSLNRNNHLHINNYPVFCLVKFVRPDNPEIKM